MGHGNGVVRVSVNTALRIVRTRWRIVTLCLLLGLLGAGAATYLTPKEYSSDVTLYVSLQGRADSSDAAYQAGQLAKDRVVSYAPLLKDERITQPVIDKLRLGITAGQLADRIQVTVQPDTVVLSAAVTDVSPQRAADIANALASEFVGLVGDLEQPIGPAPPPPAPGQSAAQPTKIGVQIIRPASAVLVPISPRPAFNLALGAALGLLVGLAAAFLRDSRDTRLRSGERLREISGAPVLAEIPHERDARLHPVDARRGLRIRPGRGVAEAADQPPVPGERQPSPGGGGHQRGRGRGEVDDRLQPRARPRRLGMPRPSRRPQHATAGRRPLPADRTRAPAS